MKICLALPGVAIAFAQMGANFPDGGLAGPDKRLARFFFSCISYVLYVFSMEFTYIFTSVLPKKTINLDIPDGGRGFAPSPSKPEVMLRTHDGDSPGHYHTYSEVPIRRLSPLTVRVEAS